MTELILAFRNFVNGPKNCALFEEVCRTAVRHIKTLKNAPTCFDHHSDHLQGARVFLIKVTDFKIC